MMAFPTSVNNQITDADTQSNVKGVAESPAEEPNRRKQSEHKPAQSSEPEENDLSQVEDGDVTNSAIIQQGNTEDLPEISDEDAVRTHEGSLQNSVPFQFTVQNIHKND